MPKVSTSIRCPSCSGPLQPASLACVPCGVRIEADFSLNEFASLGEEDLHFLRIFIHTEGRIREMESALGVSYPTVKARLAELKRKLQMDVAEIPAATPEPQADTQAVLRELEAGTITFEEAMTKLRKGATR